MQSYDFGGAGMDQNLVLILMLLPFVFGAITLWFCVVKYHKKPFLSIITSRKSFDWSRASFAFGLWMAFTAGLELLSYFLSPEDYNYQLNSVYIYTFANHRRTFIAHPDILGGNHFSWISDAGPWPVDPGAMGALIDNLRIIRSTASGQPGGKGIRVGDHDILLH